jgi:GNAT superfamily N-acetyltransferase
VSPIEHDAIPFALLEAAEADSWAEIQGHAAPRLKERFDVAVSRIAGAVVITAPKTDMLAVNRAWLPGNQGSVSSDAIATITDYARSRGLSRLLLHLPDWARGPGLTTDGWESVTPQIRFYQAAGPRSFTSRLRIVAVGPEDGELFGEIAARGNEAPPFMSDGFNSTVGQPGWRHYLAFDGSTPVSAAAVRFHRAVAWCGFAGTLPEHRGKGAQRALLARRIHDAAAAGCSWVTCESLPDGPNAPSFSRANMVATGFIPAYERPSYILRLTRSSR